MIKEIIIEKIDKTTVRAGLIIPGHPREIYINSLCLGVSLSKKSIAILNMAFKCALQAINESEQEAGE